MVRGGVTLNLFLRTTKLNYKSRPDCKLERGAPWREIRRGIPTPWILTPQPATDSWVGCSPACLLLSLRLNYIEGTKMLAAYLYEVSQLKN